MTHPLPATAPAWTLTAVSYGSPDARSLTRALYREQLATYGFADDPADTPFEEFDACGWRTASRATRTASSASVSSAIPTGPAATAPSDPRRPSAASVRLPSVREPCDG
jgi:hypothetical protein